MMVIEVQGGLGNQMFQYALGYKLALMGKEIRYDISSFNEKRENLRKLDLSIFHLEFPVATEKELIRYGHGNSFIGKISRKIGIGIERIYIDDIDRGYQQEIFSMDDVYLSGYWQSEKYFKDIRSELLKLYRMPVGINEDSKDLISEIEETVSVSLHIRRGDYLTEQNKKIYGGICTFQYYEHALELVRQKLGNIRVYIFTDAPEWAKKVFREKDYIIVEKDAGRNDAVDLFLMSKCKANIIANSSFSWWAAWLNQNEEKIVVSPKKWFNNHDTLDMICEDWLTA